MTFIEYLKNDYFVIFLKFVIFAIIFFAIYQLIRKIIEDKVITNNITKLYEKTAENTKERLKEQEKIYDEEGFKENQSTMVKLDSLIIDSGIKHKLPFMNAEVMIILTILIASIVFLILQSLTNNFYIPVVSVLCIAFIPTTVLKLMSNKRRKETDDELINFINLIENYSKTSDDIITIIGRTYPYLNEPLRSAAEDCYLEGQQTGDVIKALDSFAKKVNHKKFKTIVRNLSICSRYEANYSDVAEDSRVMLIEYLAGKREREALVKNARIEMGMIMGLSAVLIYMMGSFSGGNIIKSLQGNFIGNIILYIATAIIIVIIANMILMGKEAEE